MPDSPLYFLSLLLPLLLLLGALPGTHRWQRAVAVNITAALIAVITAVAPSLLTMMGWSVASALPSSPGGIAGQAIAVLVGLLGAVIARFSSNYLQGEANRDHFLRYLQVTLAGVVCVVMTDHLLILLFGWVVISLSLHRLLLFYPSRARAALAAHKKFLLARTAELLLLVAVVLLYLEFNSFQLSFIQAALMDSAPGFAAQIAACLIALVALIKCAQLPVHGWLIQVVEAPTPVSALLHAGVINLGGYLLMAFAPLLSQVPVAQWLLLAVAGLTLVFAALIMGLQTSIKVRLAWSTSAQMGLMLVQCALGLYTLALLHLLAHACYKAYAFLSAGSAVEQTALRRMAPSRDRGPAALALAAGTAALAVAVVAYLIGPGGVISPWLVLFALLTFVLFERGALDGALPQLSSIAIAAVLMAAYLGQKSAITALAPTLNTAPPVGADLWLSVLLVALSLMFWLLRERPQSRWVRRLAGRLFAGLYLDEWFTRVTLAVWPVRLPERPHSKQLPASEVEMIS